jgi:hypothetical protein
MRFNLGTACVAATVIIGSTTIASAQGSTDRNGHKCRDQRSLLSASETSIAANYASQPASVFEKIAYPAGDTVTL